MEQQKLNPTIVYVLAILGFLCCCFGGLGFILSGIAFIIAYSKLKDAQVNPENYTPESIKAMNTAKIVALITLIINILYLAATIYKIYTIGWDEMMEQSRQIMEQYQNQ
ncbi:CCC motif membrane protein [Confluentibacter sediminis]|uniref:CCC motif membrane protein n=1 Tax=Confluentibacter sediminis TaxID=2219045 RepID=UPI000DABA6DF|nr:CCC motif membrane protein [Confluentibacter sediminis]